MYLYTLIEMGLGLQKRGTSVDKHKQWCRKAAPNFQEQVFGIEDQAYTVSDVGEIGHALCQRAN
jgi:hypothetical protein